MDTKTQCKKIKKHLESGKSLTPLQALRLFGCSRLAARIYDLKEQGMDIKKEMVKPRNSDAHVARYSLGGA